MNILNGVKKARISVTCLVTDDLIYRLAPILDHLRREYAEVYICLYDIYRGAFDISGHVEDLRREGCRVDVFYSLRSGIRLLNGSGASTGLFLLKHAHKNSRHLSLLLLSLLVNIPFRIFAVANILQLRWQLIHNRAAFRWQAYRIAVKTSAVHMAGTVLSLMCWLFLVKPLLFFFRQRPNGEGPVKRVLMIRTDHIGDVVCTLPSLRAIRRTFPAASITLLGASWSNQPLKANPGLYDELLIADTPWLDRRPGFKWTPGSISHMRRTISTLRTAHYDLVIQPRGNGLDVLLAVLAGGRKVASTINAKLPLSLKLKPYIDLPVVLDPYKTRHIAEWPELCLTKAGVAIDEADIRNAYQIISAEDEAVFGAQVPAGFTTCVLVIGAGSWVREWPAEKFAGLINKLYEVRTIGILLGSPAERSKRDEILQYLSVPVIDLVGKTSFSNMPAVIATADFMVTLDTSVMHLASLLDKRIFALFSSGNIELSKPIFNRDVSIIKKELGCSGCGDNCFLNRPRCIERIGVNDVWSALCTTAANGIA